MVFKEGKKVGSIEIVTIIKSLWVALVPIIMKGWSIVDKRFKETEDKVEDVIKDQSEMKADIRVLVERSENHADSLQEIKDMVKVLLKSNDG